MDQAAIETETEVDIALDTAQVVMSREAVAATKAVTGLWIAAHRITATTAGPAHVRTTEAMAAATTAHRQALTMTETVTKAVGAIVTVTWTETSYRIYS